MKTLVLCLLIGLSAVACLGCNVPVFRYALERWDRDLYEIIVVKNGAFSEEEVTRARNLKAESMLGEGFLNAKVSLADLSQEGMRETLEGMYPAAVAEAEAHAVLTLFYPRDERMES